MAQETAEVSTVERLLGVCKRPPAEQLLTFNSWRDDKGKPVAFHVRALTYNEVEEINEMNRGNSGKIAAAIICKGVIAPDLRDERLQQALGVATPYEVVTKMLRAGEIVDLQIAIEKLSGYRHSTISVVADIEKN
ncbi:hypothetical protein RWV98_05840 [Agathobaculum sp. NTUH-O15-33]|uniref:phage tail assembly chaperone n=1 Tax=Agathobaculum sp. NTUH-O15-33 TaxID=3079302 RepID=UPI002958B7E8|nr:hypothetical protein [Agathobaculum sp. NTUH-O15-33]WNX85789.1 hypothetical protein RWV98_05840 [Agathobaculum sp. NTUH-O15-33]